MPLLGSLIVLTHSEEAGRLLAYLFDETCALAMEMDIPAENGVRNVIHWKSLGATVRLSPARQRSAGPP